MSSARIGNAGEHYVMACLLQQNLDAGLADRGNPCFDILVRTERGDFRALRVKATSGSTFQWTAKTEWNPLPGFDIDDPDPRDLSVLVSFGNQQPGLHTSVFVIPTRHLVSDINRVYRHYYSFPNRNGSARKRVMQRVMRLDGVKKRDNIAFGFGDDWAPFLHAWHFVRGDVDSGDADRRTALLTAGGR